MRGWPKRHVDLAIAGILLGVMVGVLLLPAMQTLRTVEIKPDSDGLLLTPNTTLVNEVRVPAGELTRVIVWIFDVYHEKQIRAADYATVKLEVTSPTGQIIRTSARPHLTMRGDISALLFNIDKLRMSEGESYKFVVRQTGHGEVWLQPPLPDQIKGNEKVAVAFQLNVTRTWLTLLVRKVYQEPLAGKDISFYYYRGRQIVKGDNPYTCAREGPGRCIGYPAHLPGIYLVAAGLQRLGVDSLDEWGSVWRAITLAAWLGVGIIMLVSIFRHGYPALAVTAFGFWLFNRWSVEVLRIAHTDFVGVFFLLLAVLIASRRPRLAVLLLSLSLAVKQVAILVVPLFLLVLWRSQKMNIRQLLALIGIVLVVPVAISLPFLLDDPLATVVGILNAMERPAQTVHGFAPSLDKFLDIAYGGKSLLMLWLVVITYVSAWRNKLSLIGGTLIILAIVMGFSPALYNQYFVWLIPFVPLAAIQSSLLKSQPSRQDIH